MYCIYIIYFNIANYLQGRYIFILKMAKLVETEIMPWNSK